MSTKKEDFIIIKCPKCKHENTFNQPYPYHAGFGDQGFLYNEKGNRTLIWDSYDPDYTAIVGKSHPWALKKAQQKKLEDLLLPDSGGRWLFSNPARCEKCQSPISEPILKNIYFLVFANSIHGIKEILKPHKS
jgi:phage FluMu protein Com